VEAVANQAVEAGYGDPAELDAFLKTENAMWRALGNELGIKPQ
jgi:hypothetical protein